MQRKGSGRLNFEASQLINSNCGGKGELCAFFLSPASNYTVMCGIKREKILAKMGLVFLWKAIETAVLNC